jgi:hypothetical protein
VAQTRDHNGAITRLAGGIRAFLERLAAIIDGRLSAAWVWLFLPTASKLDAALGQRTLKYAAHHTWADKNQTLSARVQSMRPAQKSDFIGSASLVAATGLTKSSSARDHRLC